MQGIYDVNCSLSIIIGAKPIREIIEKLKKEFHAQDIDPKELPTHLQWMQKENAYYYAQDEHIDIRMEDIEIKAIRIPVNNLTRKYTDKDFTVWSLNDISDKNSIIVVYEEATDYFYCNSSMLHLEIKLAQGISQEAVTNQTENYTEYVGLRKRYLDTYVSKDT